MSTAKGNEMRCSKTTSILLINIWLFKIAKFCVVTFDGVNMLKPGNTEKEIVTLQ